MLAPCKANNHDFYFLSCKTSEESLMLKCTIGASSVCVCGCMRPRHFQNGEKIRFVGAQTLNFQVCGCTSRMVIIANVNARLLTMLNVVGKHEHVGPVCKIFMTFCVMQFKWPLATPNVSC